VPQHVATDLCAQTGLAQLSGQRVVELARKTMDTAETLVGTWADLEPIVKVLIGRVKEYAQRPEVEAVTATKLLRECATVSSQLSSAATGVLRASEGQVRVAVLLEGPTPQRVAPEQLTEKQLVAIVLETVKKMKAESGSCPVCSVVVVAEATNGTAPPAED